MISSSFVFIIFLVAFFLLLVLLAINIDLISKLKFPYQKWDTLIPIRHRDEVEKIADVLNSVISSENTIKDIIDICPEDAITQMTYPKIYLIVSESKCLGKRCSKCLTVSENSHESNQI